MQTLGPCLCNPWGYSVLHVWQSHLNLVHLYAKRMRPSTCNVQCPPLDDGLSLARCAAVRLYETQGSCRCCAWLLSLRSKWQSLYQRNPDSAASFVRKRCNMRSRTFERAAKHLTRLKYLLPFPSHANSGHLAHIETIVHGSVITPHVTPCDFKRALLPQSIICPVVNAVVHSP